MKQYRLQMIRHGITQANAEGRYIGKTDLPLSKAGRERLENLKETYIYPPVDKVYTSPMKRAAQTAEILYPGVKIQEVAELREYDFGIFENKTIQSLAENPDYLAWIGSPNQEPPGGEDPASFGERIREGIGLVWLDMMKNGIFNAALISHAGVLGNLMAAFGVPKAKTLAWEFKDGQGYTVSTSTQLWARDMIFEIVRPVPFKEDENLPEVDHYIFPAEKTD